MFIFSCICHMFKIYVSLIDSQNIVVNVTNNLFSFQNVSIECFLRFKLKMCPRSGVSITCKLALAYMITIRSMVLYDKCL